ncbi:hypothetical protein V502_00791 [Pseudogymnoascus sp. VKM F-4520 (FW-2644)]|nr:hypothetical protein V502_00791 [Pseudogymnoascus sp. VKM F-4520 (FW-2644)]
MATYDTDRATRDHLVQPSESNEPTHFANADAPQLILPVLEGSTYSSDESSHAPLTPNSTVGESVSIPPRIYSPTANESAHYAAGGPNISPTLLAIHNPATNGYPIVRRIYAQTSTAWKRLDIRVRIGLYADDIHLRVFEKMIEAEIGRRFEEQRKVADQMARVGYGGGTEEIVNDSYRVIRQGTQERVEREVETLQREMGIFHLVTSSMVWWFSDVTTQSTSFS